MRAKQIHFVLLVIGRDMQEDSEYVHTITAIVNI